jgi:hypothetical protein
MFLSNYVRNYAKCGMLHVCCILCVCVCVGGGGGGAPPHLECVHAPKKTAELMPQNQKKIGVLFLLLTRSRCTDSLLSKRKRYLKSS